MLNSVKRYSDSSNIVTLKDLPGDNQPLSQRTVCRDVGGNVVTLSDYRRDEPKEKVFVVSGDILERSRQLIEKSEKLNAQIEEDFLRAKKDASESLLNSDNWKSFYCFQSAVRANGVSFARTVAAAATQSAAFFFRYIKWQRG